MFKILKWIVIAGIVVGIVAPKIGESTKKPLTQEEIAAKEAKKEQRRVEESELEAKKESFLSVVKQEQKVRDASWNRRELVVLVNDDGTRRDGYASYLCLLSDDHNLSGYQFVIDIFDADKTLHDEWEIIGTHQCHRGQ